MNGAVVRSRLRAACWLPAIGLCLGLCLGLWPLAVVLAQEATLEAGLDRATIRANESFTFILRATGQLPGRPDLSVLTRDFDIIDSGTSTRLQIENGRTTQVADWMVELMPRGPGTFELPAISVGNLSSNPFSIEILPAPDGDPGDAEIFIEAEVDRESVYVQSQAIFTLRLYVGRNTGRANLTAPLVEGGEAIIEMLGTDREYRTVRGSRDYNVRERKYVVFPQTPGTLRIGPAVFEVMVLPNRGVAHQERLRSAAVELTVRPAVAPPPSHPDAVWLPASRLSITESWPGRGDVFQQGVPRTRVLNVIADGLLETQLPELKLAELPGLRQYPEQPELAREVSAAGFEARRTERFAVIAQEPGSLVLPAVELPWWNVESERWEVARVDSATIAVVASAGAAAGADQGSEPATGTQTRTVVEPDAGFWPWLSGALALGWLATGLVWLARTRSGRRPAVTVEAAVPLSGRALMKQLEAACRVNDARRTRDLLLEWAGRQFADAPPASLGGLAGRLSGPLAAEIMALEAALYGPQALDWRGDRLAGLIRETRSVDRERGSQDQDPLVPLYR